MLNRKTPEDILPAFLFIPNLIPARFCVYFWNAIKDKCIYRLLYVKWFPSQETVLAPSEEAAIKRLEQKYGKISFEYTEIEKVGAQG